VVGLGVEVQRCSSAAVGTASEVAARSANNLGSDKAGLGGRGRNRRLCLPTDATGPRRSFSNKHPNRLHRLLPHLARPRPPGAPRACRRRSSRPAASCSSTLDSRFSTPRPLYCIPSPTTAPAFPSPWPPTEPSTSSSRCWPHTMSCSRRPTAHRKSRPTSSWRSSRSRFVVAPLRHHTNAGR
jgi:hypothetical protein